MDTILEKLPARTAAAWKVIPLNVSDDLIRIAAVAPDMPELLANLRVLVGLECELAPIDEGEFNRRFSDVYGIGAGDIDEATPEPDEQPAVEVSAAADSAMPRFVDRMIRQAVNERATDIHIEPFDSEIDIRFRIDGILHPVPVPAPLAGQRAALASRIKVMAGMNISERRLPQDGRIRLAGRPVDSNAEAIDIRVSTVPTIHGESIDLRLLPKGRLVMGLDHLGMSRQVEERVERLIERPNGILLVTGPTGHGKSTTLYACLSRLNTPHRKIIAIEDPVEYRIRGINQIQVHPKIGLTFAAALRSVLRQDPDVIMVGEIRDRDTAEIAIRASLTGHLVFSTLHTNDSIEAITRLIDMGIEPYLVASSVNAVIGQRLVRTVCSGCRGGESASCRSCRGSGYHGRSGIFELFELGDEVREMIHARASSHEIRRRAVLGGMTTLLADGRRKCSAGITTEAELSRVAGGGI